MCREKMQISESMPILGPLFHKEQKFKSEVMNMAVKEARQAGIKPVQDMEYPQLALEKCTYYECAKCSVAFFAGMLDCRISFQEEKQLTREQLMCK